MDRVSFICLTPVLNIIPALEWVLNNYFLSYIDLGNTQSLTSANEEIILLCLDKYEKWHKMALLLWLR